MSAHAGSWIQAAILEFGIAKTHARVGLYAGAIESAFGLAQFCTVIAWGRLSDRIGRKPVIVMGLLGACASTVMFGLSRNLWTLLLSRTLQGALNGNAGVLKASLAELTTDENKGRAFACVARPLAIADSESSADGPFIAAHASLIAQTWAVGAALGPLIGGWCAPGGLMERPPVAAFPFLLPCLVSALFPLVGALVAGQFLVETLPAKAVDAPDQPSEPVLPIRDLLTPQVRALLVTYAMLALQTISLAALLPLFAFTPIASGGLGFSTAAIGTAMSFYGLSGAAIQLAIYPPLQRRFGTARAFRYTAALYAPLFLAYPLVSLVASHASRKATWAALICALFLGGIANMCYSSVMVMTNDASPTRNSLGAVNGLAQSIASGFRAIGPIAATSIFAVSIEHNILHGWLVWLLLAVLALGTSTSALRLHDRVAWRESEDEAKSNAPTVGRGA